jgi:DNA polymerase-3 subunit delta
VGWAADRAKATYGKRLGQSAAYRLREHIGDSPGAMDAELAKLSSYVGERGEITTDDIAALTGQLREEKSFAVLDAIASGDAGSALGLWAQTLATDKAAPALAIGGLSFGLRRLLEARVEYDSGVHVGTLARKLFTSPDIAEQRLRRCNPEMLREMQRDLLAVDLAVKTGGSTVGIAIEKFIVTHTALGKKPSVKTG